MFHSKNFYFSFRVLAPPGGGSSNIFGGNDEAPVQRKSAAPKPQSDILNQGPPAPAPAQSAKPNPKIGEDSFRLFGDHTPHRHHAKSISGNDCFARVDTPVLVNTNRSNDSFSNVYGSSNETPTNLSIKLDCYDTDSYTNIFGSLNDSGKPSPRPKSTSESMTSILSPDTCLLQKRSKFIQSSKDNLEVNAASNEDGPMSSSSFTSVDCAEASQLTAKENMISSFDRAITISSTRRKSLSGRSGIHIYSGIFFSLPICFEFIGSLLHVLLVSLIFAMWF